MDHQTNDGAVELVSNETGQNITQYFKFNPDRSSVTVSNSTITADFAIQIPDQTDPNTVKVNRINLPLLDVSYITKHNATDTNPAFTSYYASYRNISITIGNTTYTGIELFVNVPNDEVNYRPAMYMYLHP